MTTTMNEVESPPLNAALLREWERLHAAYNAAHDECQRVHAQLSKRMRDAGRGVRCCYPISEDIEAHLAASSALEQARQAMHEFCRENAAYC